jgi:tetratricopeptide (TPR) repeat protein
MQGRCYVIAAAAVVWTLTATPARPAEISDRSEEFVRHAYETTRPGGPFERITKYTAAIDKNPNDVNAYIERGKAYRDDGDGVRAIEDFTTAIELDPHRALPYHLRAMVYDAIGDLDHGLADCKSAIAIDPKFSDPYAELGYNHNMRGEHKEAVAAYTKSLALDPKSARVYSNRAETYSRLDEYDSAVKDLKAAIHLDRGDAGPTPILWARLGDAQLHGGRAADAIASYRKATSLGLGMPVVHFHMAVAYAVTSDWPHARAELKSGIAGAGPDEVSDANDEISKAIARYPNSAALKKTRALLASLAKRKPSR